MIDNLKVEEWVLVDEAFINAGKSCVGTWVHRQMELLGVPEMHPRKFEALVCHIGAAGKMITREAADEFLALRNSGDGAKVTQCWLDGYIREAKLERDIRAYREAGHAPR